MLTVADVDKLGLVVIMGAVDKNTEDVAMVCGAAEEVLLGASMTVVEAGDAVSF